MKIKLVENFRLNIKPEQIEILDSEKLTESIDGKQYKARAILRRVPVSKFTENLNGRIYPKSLDEKILKEKTAEGNLGLLDHPSEKGENPDGSVKDIGCVWHNFTIGENFSYADAYLVGKGGELIKEAIEAGAKGIGISRSGFGEFLEDNKTVNPDTYDLERISDFVLNPSQSVFATMEHLDTNYDDDKKDNQIQEKIENKIVENTNKKINENESYIINDKKEDVIMLDKIQEANLKNQVRIAIKEAKGKSNFKEAIEDLNELKNIVPAELQEVHNKIDNSVSELQGKMEEHVNNSTKALQEKESKYAELNKKYELANKAVKEIKEKYLKAKSLLEKSSKVSEKDHKILKENVVKIYEDLKKVLKERDVMLKDIKQMLKDRLNMNEDIKVLKDRLKKSIKEMKGGELKNSKLEKTLKIAEKHIAKLEKILEEEYGYEFDEEDEEEVVVNDDVTMDASAEDMEEEDGDVEGAVDEIDADEEGEEIEEEDETTVDPEADYELVNNTDDEEMSEEENEDLEEEEETSAQEVEDSLEAGELKEYVFGRHEKPRMKENKPKKKVKKVKESVQLRKEIFNYYKKAVTVNPAVKDIKGSVLKAKSLVEAVKMVESFKNKKNEMIKVDIKKISADEDYLGHRL